MSKWLEVTCVFLFVVGEKLCVGSLQLLAPHLSVFRPFGGRVIERKTQSENRKGEESQIEGEDLPPTLLS